MNGLPRNGSLRMAVKFMVAYGLGLIGCAFITSSAWVSMKDGA